MNPGSVAQLPAAGGQLATMNRACGYTATNAASQRPNSSLPEEWPDALIDATIDADFDHETKQELVGMAKDLVVSRLEANNRS